MSTIDATDNLTMHTDDYEINMMATYFEKNMQNRHAVFEVYFRDMPFGNGYAVFAGLEHVVDYINNIKFTDSDVDYLREHGDYSEKFLEYLRNFKFKGTIRSAQEGDLVFNKEPIMQVEGTIAECQLVETAILNIVNYQTLIATKAARIRSVAGKDPLMEFGSRRAQEVSAALWGTRACYIGGFDITSNVLAGKEFNIPISGTHAHSLVESFGNDYDAFKAYAETHRNCVFLVDTFDTLKSGVPNAIKVAKEMGDKINFNGVRIDSGDMAYISKRVREMLDKAGFPDAKIYASNDLDEYTISSLKMQHAKIDVWGVGTKVITAFDQPALGAVYKLVSVEDKNGKMVDTIKLSNNAEKVSTPGKKQVWRITEKKDGKSEGDYVTLADEDPRKEDSLYMFHPQYTYINKTIHDFNAEPLLKDIYRDGKLVYEMPSLDKIKKHANKVREMLWPEYKRMLNPEAYPVDLSQEAWDNKMKLIKEIRNGSEKRLQ
ncbi:nicotinate phosphoribosyltransferase [Fructilactobacillus lindneri]|uniref:Nicotinate phosphoribosyltransferase n=2 Tax=Fructilactobacillus lindneri TaxID=53444 RepID=A0A0R2JU73_9LACO|nr:nicotinate phosphoribosyltransferase [Fructilactobacillus lindneri]ANZ58580.1 nicotinate phosphoribosyltransferase [Fructilactobacillus lindneri]KRN79350.1 Nicotinate phosphoribosyltransferase [Fructilactobacillus lindneri DSM 20690 = JCM 11027]POG98379.1 nicotinate phosphoribosyltransferase [Fructilactobacillus lindneri]POH03778.1 nicotinate phosphoribosyltransferase [Fructilactobacillus lindneri]POH04978.1 nicotinate phosphoribosyltransferase [Fructilactobacillus lindneri]